jgi:hypothetical protein
MIAEIPAARVRKRMGARWERCIVFSLVVLVDGDGSSRYG